MSETKKKILVVDDEMHITTLYQAVLGQEGYEVVVCQDGKEALEKAPKSMPSLIILDIKLPDLTGWDICRKLKEDAATKNIPVLMASAFGQKADQDKSFSAGASAFLKKPFDSKTLITQVEKLL